MSKTDALMLDAADWGRGSTVRLGVVAEADYARARVRVRISGGAAGADALVSALISGEDGTSGEAVTGWLPWATWAAGHLRVWSPPAEGEQCLVLAPSGDLAQAVAVPAAFQQRGAFPAPASDPKLTLLKWEDEAYLSYQYEKHELIVYVPDNLIKIECDGDGKIEILARKLIKIQCDENIEIIAGKDITMQAGGDVVVTGNTISLN
jgi:phage baseplate assembly protein V